MEVLWRIEMFGGLRAVHPERTLDRFRTHKTGALLALLALAPDRPQPREILIDALWPDDPLESAQQKLRSALTSLRRQMEPPGVPSGLVIAADRLSVRLRSDGVSTDVAEHERALRAAERPGVPWERAQWLAAALDLYSGPLLPGFYEDRILTEARRLHEQFFAALGRLLSQLEELGEIEAALEHGRRGLAHDPAREELHHTLMRLLAASGRPAAALRQYQMLEQALAEQGGAAPTAPVRALARRLAEMSGVGSGAEAKPPAGGSEAREAAEPFTPPATSVLPTGTVTFLLAAPGTSGDEANLGIAVRAEAESRGYFAPSEGAPVMAVFADARQALACALACRSLPALAGARMALHTGAAGDESYRGEARDHAARLLLATPPGQILCTGVTAALAAEARDAADALYLSDLGLYRLADRSGPVRLYRVHYSGDGNACDDFPPPNAPRELMGRLPLPATRFFGRQTERAELSHWLAAPDIRLITLTGPGGVGKTRLALETARAAATAPGGRFAAAWFLSLADLSDAARLPEALHSALGLPPSPQRDALEQAEETLAAQSSLLVLDNLEHLVEEGGEFVAGLLARIDNLVCLVTSRRSLEVAGERQFPVPPLPSSDGARTLEALAQVAGVQIFVDRAQAVRPDFDMTARNAPVLAELCDRLDGLPLALELAAARVSVLTPRQMLDQLSRRFDLLAAGRRDAPARHRTLWGALDWSWGLLPEDVRRFFADLSLFRGGWTVEAARAVGTPPGGEVPTLDTLALLQECSFVAARDDGTGNGRRFGMLETLREFAGAHLTGEKWAATAGRHAGFFLALAEQAAPELLGAQANEWLDRLEAEHENLRAALSWAGRAGEMELGLRLAAALWRFWYVRGHIAEGEGWLEEMLTRDESQKAPRQASSSTRVRALHNLAALRQLRGDYARSEAPARECLALSQATGNTRGEGAALNLLGVAAQRQRNYQAAEEAYRQALELMRSLGNEWNAAMALQNLAIVAMQRDDLAEAQRLHEENLALRRKLGDLLHVAMALFNLGAVAAKRGDFPGAEAFFREALAINRELGHGDGVAMCLANLGKAAEDQGDYERAAPLYAEAIQRFRESDTEAGVADCFAGLAMIASRQGRPERAARLLAVTAGLRTQTNLQPGPDQQAREEEVLGLARASLGDEAFEAALASGRATPWRQMIAELQARFALSPETGT